MVVGSGIDVMAVGDMQRELAHGPWTPADGIFLDSELRYCNAAHSPARRLAACFVTKEAALKALDFHVAALDAFRDVEVVSIESGNVRVRFHGRAQEQCRALGVKQVLAAMHSDRYLAAAMVVLEA